MDQYCSFSKISNFYKFHKYQIFKFSNSSKISILFSFFSSKFSKFQKFQKLLVFVYACQAFSKKIVPCVKHCGFSTVSVLVNFKIIREIIFTIYNHEDLVKVVYFMHISSNFNIDKSKYGKKKSTFPGYYGSCISHTQT